MKIVNFVNASNPVKFHFWNKSIAKGKLKLLHATKWNNIKNVHCILLVDLILELHTSDISEDLEVTGGEQSSFSLKTTLPSTSWGPGTLSCSYAIRTQPWRRTDDLQYAVLNIINNKLINLKLSIRCKNMNISAVLQIKMTMRFVFFIIQNVAIFGRLTICYFQNKMSKGNTFFS